MRYIRVLITITIMCIFLSGCYDKKELEQQAYVIAIGVDKGEKENSYRFTYQIANPEVGSTIGGGGSKEPASEIITITGTDFITSTTTANTSVSKSITLDHTKVLVISEELAKSEEFIRVMQAAQRVTQIRRQVNVIVSKESAEKFLQSVKPKLETRPHKFYQLIINRSTETGIVPESNIHRFFQITEGDADLFLAIYATTEKADEAEQKDEAAEDGYKAGEIPKEGGNPVQFMGSAVFKEGQMIDTLDGQETRLALVMDNTLEIRDLLSTYQDPVKEEYRVSADFSKKMATEVKIDYKKNGITKINVRVPFQVEVLAIPSLVPYSQKPDLREKLKDSIEEELEKKAEKLVKKAQEDYGSDPFYWSLYVRDEFASVKEYEKADWNKKIWPNAQVTINFDCTRLEFGKMVNDSKLPEVKD